MLKLRSGEELIELTNKKRKRKLLRQKESSTKKPAQKNLQKSTKLKPSKVQLFLEGKNAQTKHKNYRKRFPKLKVIAYDINEIWSLNLAYVDKFAKENKEVKYFWLRWTASHDIYNSNP